MANVLTLRGFFGNKQSFWVTPSTVTTGWYAGQLFKVASVGAAYVAGGSYTGAPVGRGPFVSLNAASGAAIAGVAMEGSADVSTAVSGMTNASGSMVTLLWGPSSFSVRYGGTATTAKLRQTGGCPWEPGVESASLMATLFASVNGKFASDNPRSIHGTFTNAAEPVPIGYLSEVPAATNSWTMGVVLF